MYTAILMTGKLYVMETKYNDIADVLYDDGEMERCRTFISEGTPVTFVEDVEDLEELFPNTEIIMVERD